MHGSIWQVVDTREGADFGGTAARVHTVLRQHRDTDVVRNPAPLCDPNMLIPDPAIRSPRRLPFSAIVRPPRHRLHRVLERAGRMNISSGMLNRTDSNRSQSRLRRDVFFRTDFEISEPIRTDRSTRGFKYNLPFGPKGAEIFHPRHPGQKSSASSSLSNVVTSRARVHAATPPSTRD